MATFGNLLDIMSNKKKKQTQKPPCIEVGMCIGHPSCSSQDGHIYWMLSHRLLNSLKVLAPRSDRTMKQKLIGRDIVLKLVGERPAVTDPFVLRRARDKGLNVEDDVCITVWYHIDDMSLSPYWPMFRKMEQLYIDDEREEVHVMVFSCSNGSCVIQR